MAAAIWSCGAEDAGRQPAASFIRFCDNHGLLRVSGRPVWRTVRGGSREYVALLTESFADRIHTGTAALAVERLDDAVRVVTSTGVRAHSHAVLACHGDQALRLLGESARPRERKLLSAFRYAHNLAVLHTDETLMPKRRAVWASWNYLGETGIADTRPSVTYWMNQLQGLPEDTQYFRDAQSASPASARDRCCEVKLTSIRCSTPRRSARNAGCGSCRGTAACGSAAPISAPVFMRMDCRRASPWRSSLGGRPAASRGKSRMRSGRIHPGPTDRRGDACWRSITAH